MTRQLTQVRTAGERGSGGELSGDALEEGTDFSEVLAATRGDHIGRLAMPVPEWDGPPADDEERARRALHEVADPELPVSIVDLGLVYDVEVDDGQVTVELTFTATACPCMDFIKWDVRSRLLEEGFDRVTVVETWDPPWTTERITDRGREALGRAGVSI
jgi:metal-sulfur cluster biosynthetic enzyme